MLELCSMMATLMMNSLAIDVLCWLVALSESSMTRVMKANELHDYAMLTAFRTYNDEGKPVSKRRNIHCNNNKLGQALRCLYYGITHVVRT